MHRNVLFPCLLALAVGGFAGHSLAEDAPAKEPAPKKATPKFEQFQLIFLRRGAKSADLTRAERAALGPQHLAHLEAMTKSGRLVLAGPVGEKDDGALAGVCIYRTDDLDAARKLASEDPMVKAGALDVQAATWYVKEGYVAFPKAPKPAPKKEPADK